MKVTSQTITVYHGKDGFRVVAGDHEQHAGSKSDQIAVYPNANLAFRAESNPAIRAAILRIAPDVAPPAGDSGSLPPLRHVSIPMPSSARLSDHRFRIGHPSYSGANARTGLLRAADALLELIRRGVARPAAQRVLAQAAAGAHAVATTDAGNAIEVFGVPA